MNPDILTRIFHRYYVPNNAAVIISGDVTRQEAFRLTNQRFGHWKRQSDPFAGFTAVTPPPVPRSLNAVSRPQIEAYVRRYLHAPMVVGLLVPRGTGTSLNAAVSTFLAAPVEASQTPAPSPAQ